MDPTKLPGAYGSAYGPLMDPTELPGVSSSAQEDQEDLSIPRAAINKMIKDTVPSFRVANDARDLITNCCTEFIRLIATEANEICEKDQKKTISPEHVLSALDKSGFAEYRQDAIAVLRDCKEVTAKRRRGSMRLENLGISEEELLRQQQELFARAREAEKTNVESDWIKTQEALMLRHQEESLDAGHNSSEKDNEDDDDDYD